MSRLQDSLDRLLNSQQISEEKYFSVKEKIENPNSSSYSSSNNIEYEQIIDIITGMEEQEAS